MRMNLDHVASGHFVIERATLSKFDYWPLAVIIPPAKVARSVNLLNAVIMSFNPNEKLSVICEKAMKRMRAIESDGVKSARKAKHELHKACERASETRERPLHRPQCIRPKCLAVKTDLRTDC